MEQGGEVKRRGVKRWAEGGGGEAHKSCKRNRRDGGSSAKDRISKIPPCVVGKRSSVYRGVTRHRWTGRFEAHLWDKSSWNQAQKKKGKQVYLGAYDDEEAAARAYDLAALKYWGPGTTINFPVTDYGRDIEEMEKMSREEYLASLRRKSSGFSRGVSKYRGVARHHHNGRWEARIGRVFGNKYLYLGTYGTQEEAAAAYDVAAIQYRGVNAVTNFDLSRYITWLRPAKEEESPAQAPVEEEVEEQQQQLWPGQASEPYQFPSLGMTNASLTPAAAPPTALGLLLQSSVYKRMLDRVGAEEGLDVHLLTSLEEELPSFCPAEEDLESAILPFWNSLPPNASPQQPLLTV